MKFNLSEKGTVYNKGDTNEVRLFKEKDVKEFIRLLKYEIEHIDMGKLDKEEKVLILHYLLTVEDKIKELAGDKLI